MHEKHTFALYVKKLDVLISDNNEVSFSEEQLAYRIRQVLRLQQNDSVIFFDRLHYAIVKLTEITKKSIHGIAVTIEENSILVPKIKLLLPVLKKDALADAIYSAVEVGANEVQLVYTQKAQRIISSNEYGRLERVAIAAAEQSKNFAFPVISKPLFFDEAVEIAEGAKLFFDPTGKNMKSVLTVLECKSHDIITLLVGPEGDLTQEKKKMIADDQWIFCALTPTVLRSVQAVSIGLGIMRSMTRNL